MRILRGKKVSQWEILGDGASQLIITNSYIIPGNSKCFTYSDSIVKTILWDIILFLISQIKKLGHRGNKPLTKPHHLIFKSLFLIAMQYHGG